MARIVSTWETRPCTILMQMFLSNNYSNRQMRGSNSRQKKKSSNFWSKNKRKSRWDFKRIWIEDKTSIKRNSRNLEELWMILIFRLIEWSPKMLLINKKRKKYKKIYKSINWIIKSFPKRSKGFSNCFKIGLKSSRTRLINCRISKI